MKKRIDYPTLPFISVGLIGENEGVYFTLPFKPISLNEYRSIHSGLINKTKQRYKSILDVMIISYYRKNYITLFDENGLFVKPLFDSQIDIEWILNFKDVRKRDPSNYTQKIFLDAVVWTGMLIDDCEKYIKSDKVYFGHNKFNSITVLLLGNILHNRVKCDMPSTKLDEIYKNLGVE